VKAPSSGGQPAQPWWTCAATNGPFAYDLNKRRLEGDFGETRWGQACAVLLALAGTTACVVTAHIGADWRVSVGLGAAVVRLLVVPFLRGAK